MQQSFPPTDWFVYNNHKIIKLQDPTCFDCENTWEIDFLVTVLQKTFPHISGETMKDTIDHCSKNFSVPINKDLFVRCVMETIAFRE